MPSRLYLGLMSGTSQDGIDAVLLRTGPAGKLQVAGHLARRYPAALRHRLLALAENSAPVDIAEYARLDDEVARAFAATATATLRKFRVAPHRVRAIGSHGQTVFHDPAGTGSSLQLGNPSRIAALTGITTVADFRRADIAAGGQGAPLAPAFHLAAFGSRRETRAVLNLGGIANITVLPANGRVTGFDTGPGNALLDEWIRRHRHRPFDRNGGWARSGTLHEGLLRALLSDPFLHKAPPKSTGRESFNLRWLQRRYPSVSRLKPVDVQRTLLEFTACSVASALAVHARPARRVLVCGGGVNNRFLLQRLVQRIGCPVESTAAHGIDPQQVEAAAFAWLAFQTLEGNPGNLPSVTGARRPVVLGGIYSA